MAKETSPNSNLDKIVLPVVASLAVLALLDHLHHNHQPGPSFNVIQDGSCYISTDNARFEAARGEGVEALALHTDGVDDHGSKTKCLSAVMKRVVRFNNLQTYEQFTNSANAVVEEGRSYEVPRFATTHHSYDGTSLNVVGKE